MKKLLATQIADATSLGATTNYAFTADHSKVISVHAIWTATTVSATAKLQYSNDGSNWEDFAAATNVTANGTVFWAVDGSKDAVYWRVVYTHTSGSSTTFKVYVANIVR